MERIPRDRILDLLPLMLAFAVAWLVIGTWIARWDYPYDLEWMEGGMLAHAWRLQQGLELYPAPNPDFIPFVYPPGYTSILALLGNVWTLGHPLGRAMSALSSLAAAAAVVFGVHRHGGSAAIGVMAAAVFLGTYASSGAFMDLVRPDSGHVALLAWSIVLGLEDRRGAAAAAGLLLAASFLFKHNAAAYGLPMALGIAMRSGWRQGLAFAMSAALPALGATLYMQGVSDGRFLNYLISVPGSHPLVANRGWPNGAAEIGEALTLPLVGSALWMAVRTPKMAQLSLRFVAVSAGLVALVLGVYGYGIESLSGVRHPSAWVRIATFSSIGVLAFVGVLTAVRRRSDTSWRLVYGAGIGGVALATAMLMRAHHGGFINVFLPAHWVVAFAVGMAAARARQTYGGWLTTSVLAFGFSAHLLVVAWDFPTDKFRPTEEDREAGARVVAQVAACTGPVHSPYAAWIPVQAGFAPSMHAIALWDVTHKRGPFRAHVEGLHEAAREQYWGCVVDGGSRPLGISIPAHYVPSERFSIQGGVFRPKTGWRARPTQILTPKP